jgi:hypothetical protein
MTLIGMAAARAATAKTLSSENNASLVAHLIIIATIATAPDISITRGVTLDMSRTGAPHTVCVVFCAAVLVSLHQ